MQVNIQIEGLAEVRAMLGNAAKQANFAAMQALNTTAFAINKKLKTEMKATFKGGATQYTQNAFSVEKAEKRKLKAEVTLRTDTPAGGTNYTQALAHLFNGGGRKNKNLEGWLLGHNLMSYGLSVAPGRGMKLDKFGNMNRKMLTEILTVIGTRKNRMRIYQKTGRGKAQKAIDYFVVQDDYKSKLHPGIYKRIETGTSSTVVPMILYIDPVRYRRFIDLEKLGREVVAQTFQPAFDMELARALANAK
jgi:hypothetical protein